MSSLLDRLENKALTTLDAHGADWLMRAVDQGRAQLQNVGGTPALDAARASSLSGLDRVAAHAQDLADLGYQSGLAFFGRLATGQTAVAARILAAYGGGKGGWAAADLKVATAADRTETTKRNFDKAKSIAEDIGVSAAKDALPFLMSAVVAL